MYRMKRPTTFVVGLWQGPAGARTKSVYFTLEQRKQLHALIAHLDNGPWKSSGVTPGSMDAFTVWRPALAYLTKADIDYLAAFFAGALAALGITPSTEK